LKLKPFKNKYIEFTPDWSGFSLKYHIAGYFDPSPNLQIYFIWGKLFINLPWRHYKKIKIKKSIKDIRKDKLSTLSDKKSKIEIKYTKNLYDESTPPTYGISFSDKQFSVNYGYTYKSFYLPWHWEWIRTSCLVKDGTWLSETRKSRNMEFWNHPKWKDIIFSETYTYKYTTKYGEEQNCLATIRVEEREWRWKWLTWLKYIRLIRKDIEIEFSDDIGERKGTWKGGTTGCSYTMKKGETPYETLKRMETERKF